MPLKLLLKQITLIYSDKVDSLKFNNTDVPKMDFASYCY